MLKNFYPLLTYIKEHSRKFFARLSAHDLIINYNILFFVNSILFSIGVLVAINYFSSIYHVAISCIILALINYKFRKEQISKLVSIAMIGFILTSVRIYCKFKFQPDINYKPEFTITAKVEKKFKNRIITSSVNYDNLKLANCIFYSKRKIIKDVKEGDKIEFIGKVGHTKTNAFLNREVININALSSKNCKGKIININNIDTNQNSAALKIRNKISNIILNNLGQADGLKILATLLTGEKKHSSAFLNSFSSSGLAHILAVSGLHISIIAGTIFVVTRKAMSRLSFLQNNFDIKKLSLALALLTATVYVFIIQKSNSSIRSYLMFITFCASIILQKQSSAIRAWSVALLVILVFQPWQILTASFQLSFIATLILIQVFSRLSSKNYTKYFLINALLNLLLSSLLISLSLLPYEIYHFSKGSINGVFANLLAIPITEVIVLPLALLGVITYPIFIGKFLIQISSYAAFFVINIAQFVSEKGLPEITFKYKIGGFSIFLFTMAIICAAINLRLMLKYFLSFIALFFLSYHLGKYEIIFMQIGNNIFQLNDEAVLETEHRIPYYRQVALRKNSIKFIAGKKKIKSYSHDQRDSFKIIYKKRNKCYILTDNDYFNSFSVIRKKPENHRRIDSFSMKQKEPEYNIEISCNQ